MNGTSIRNIRRNISEAATGSRCNRYGDTRLRKEGQPAAYSFKNYRKAIASYVTNLFKLDEYLKHAVNAKALQRAINEERFRG